MAETSAAKGQNEMKPRHAAVLALVGWYLMMPPPRQQTDGKGRLSLTRDIDSTAPLSTWEVGAAFNSPQECNQALGELRTKINREIANPDMRADERHFYTGKSAFAQCIATDDPRLKPK